MYSRVYKHANTYDIAMSHVVMMSIMDDDQLAVGKGIRSRSPSFEKGDLGQSPHQVALALSPAKSTATWSVHPVVGGGWI
jgi:hypothetical protein